MIHMYFTDFSNHKTQINHLRLGKLFRFCTLLSHLALMNLKGEYWRWQGPKQAQEL